MFQNERSHRNKNRALVDSPIERNWLKTAELAIINGVVCVIRLRKRGQGNMVHNNTEKQIRSSAAEILLVISTR